MCIRDRCIRDLNNNSVRCKFIYRTVFDGNANFKQLKTYICFVRVLSVSVREIVKRKRSKKKGKNDILRSILQLAILLY